MDSKKSLTVATTSAAAGGGGGGGGGVSSTPGVNPVSSLERTALSLLVHVFRRLVDGERVLDMLRTQLVTAREFDVWQLFEYLDTEGAGYLTVRELSIFLRSIECYACDADVLACWRRHTQLSGVTSAGDNAPRSGRLSLRRWAASIHPIGHDSQSAPHIRALSDNTNSDRESDDSDNEKDSNAQPGFGGSDSEGGDSKVLIARASASPSAGPAPPKSTSKRAAGAGAVSLPASIHGLLSRLLLKEIEVESAIALLCERFHGIEWSSAAAAVFASSGAAGMPSAPSFGPGPAASASATVDPSTLAKRTLTDRYLALLRDTNAIAPPPAPPAAAAASLPAPSSLGALLHACFSRFDVNGDRVVSGSDLRTAIQLYSDDGWTLSNTELSLLMRRFGVRSGAGITYERFLEAFLPYKTANEVMTYDLPFLIPGDAATAAVDGSALPALAPVSPPRPVAVMIRSNVLGSPATKANVPNQFVHSTPSAATAKRKSPAKPAATPAAASATKSGSAFRPTEADYAQLMADGAGDDDDADAQPAAAAVYRSPVAHSSLRSPPHSAPPATAKRSHKSPAAAAGAATAEVLAAVNAVRAAAPPPAAGSSAFLNRYKPLPPGSAGAQLPPHAFTQHVPLPYGASAADYDSKTNHRADYERPSTASVLPATTPTPTLSVAAAFEQYRAAMNALQPPQPHAHSTPAPTPLPATVSGVADYKYPPPHSASAATVAPVTPTKNGGGHANGATAAAALNFSHLSSVGVDSHVAGAPVPAFKVRSPLPKAKIHDSFELTGPFAVRTHLFAQLKGVNPALIVRAASNEHALALFLDAVLTCESVAERIKQQLTTYEDLTLESAFDACLPLATPNSPLKHLTLSANDIIQFISASENASLRAHPLTIRELLPFMRSATRIAAIAGGSEKKSSAATASALSWRQFGGALIPRSRTYTDVLSARNTTRAHRTAAKRLEEDTSRAFSAALQQLIAVEYIVERCRESLSRRGSGGAAGSPTSVAAAAGAPFNFWSAFQLLDRRETGAATAADFKDFLKAYEITPTPDQVVDLFARFDVSMSGRISYGEFVHELLQSH